MPAVPETSAPESQPEETPAKHEPGPRQQLLRTRPSLRKRNLPRQKKQPKRRRAQRLRKQKPPKKQRKRLQRLKQKPQRQRKRKRRLLRRLKEPETETDEEKSQDAICSNLFRFSSSGTCGSCEVRCRAVLETEAQRN